MTVAGPTLETVPPAAARSGADLRDARERLNISLEDVASRLHIRRPHLVALEEGRISLLPGNTYALGFVRNYAATLGLDPEEMVRRFRAETAVFDRSTELVFPAQVAKQNRSAGAMAVLGLVMAVSAFAGWYYLPGESRLAAEAIAAVPTHLLSLAEQAFAFGSGPAKEHRDGAQDDATVVPALAANIRAESRGSNDLAHPPGAASAANAIDASHVVLRANADAWFLVRDRDSAVLLDRSMKAGEIWRVPARSDLMLTTDNAGETDILVDGAVVPGLAGGGTVRRDIPLDPGLIKAGGLGRVVVPDAGSTHAGQ